MNEAPEILELIYRQIKEAQAKVFKPKIRIWMSKNDERMLIFSVQPYIYDVRMKRLFGEEVIISDDAKDGHPEVEVIPDR